MSRFDPILPDVLDQLPHWWAVDDDSSLLVELLGDLTAPADEIARVLQQVADDAALLTAGPDALRREYAWIWGVEFEDLPGDIENLRTYLLERAGDDGSLEALRRALLALLQTPANLDGVELVFPADGSGLHFPADGSGLRMFQHTPYPDAELRFPADGSGLHFPADGTGIRLYVSRWLFIDEDVENYSVTFTVPDYLAFDQAAFARAIERQKQKHLTTTIVVD